MHHQLVVTDPSQTSELCALFQTLYDQHEVFCFHGEMGAGKTTLIKQLCQQRGVTEGMSSPTFSIVNEYHDANKQPILHMDLYRLEDESELLQIGWDDYLNMNATIFIEWPEKAPNLIPDDAVHVHISINDQSEARTLTINQDL